MSEPSVRLDDVKTAWFFVRAPDVFMEFSLPMRSEDFINEDRRNLKKLREFSDQHGIFIDRRDESQAPSPQGLTPR